MSDILTFARKALGIELYPGQAEALAGYYESGKQVWLLLSGRRGGKSLLADVIASFEAVVPDFGDVLRPGEERYIIVVSVRQDSANAHIRQIGKLLRHTKELGRLIVEQTKEMLRLSNGTIILSLPCSARAVRGWTASTLILDEAAHFVDVQGNSSAADVLAALEPTTATFGARARVIIPTTPAARSGLVYDLFERAQEGLLEDVYVTKKATRELNPRVSEKTIARARSRDAESAAVEYDAEFREPVEAFLDSEKLALAIDKSRRRCESATPGVSYTMAVDPAVMQDRYAFVVGHREGERVIVDYANLLHPPVNPTAAEDLLKDLVRRFHPTVIRTDSAALVQRLKGAMPALQYDPFTRPKKLKWYGSLKELVNLELLELYPDEDLLDELRALQIRGGVDIGAPKAGRTTHDDLSDCCALVVDHLAAGGGTVRVTPNPFYSLGPGEWFVPTSIGGYVKMPIAGTRIQHALTAEAVASCAHRRTGCAACVSFYDGQITREAEEAAAIRRGEVLAVSDEELERVMAQTAGYGPDDLRLLEAEDRDQAKFHVSFMREVHRRMGETK